MKTFTPLLAAAFLLAGLAPTTAAEEPLFPYPYHSETLDNGLQVLLVPMSSGGLLSYWSIVRTGARDEYEPGRTGFAHFFEHMMFRGTEKYPSDAYDDIVTGMGANANAFTSNDLTAYHLNIAAEDLEQVMEIESDRFRNLAYPEDMFRTEAGAVYGEYRKNRTSPYFLIYESLLRTAFTHHTYGHTAMGFEEDIQKMPDLFDYSKTFFDRYYRPDNTVLVIAGDLEVEPVMELVRKYYGDWQAGYVAPEITPEPPQTAERRVEIEYPGNTLPLLYVAYKVGAWDPNDLGLVAGELLCELAFGETSEIYKELVLDRQTLEDIEASIGFWRDPGLLIITATLKSADEVDATLQRIDAEIESLRQHPPSADRLAGLKSRLKYDFLLGLDTPDRVIRSLNRVIAVTGGIEAIETYFQTADQVTPEAVRAAAEALLAPERRTIAILRGNN